MTIYNIIAIQLMFLVTSQVFSCSSRVAHKHAVDALEWIKERMSEIETLQTSPVRTLLINLAEKSVVYNSCQTALINNLLEGIRLDQGSLRLDWLLPSTGRPRPPSPTASFPGTLQSKLWRRPRKTCRKKSTLSFKDERGNDIGDDKSLPSNQVKASGRWRPSFCNVTPLHFVYWRNNPWCQSLLEKTDPKHSSRRGIYILRRDAACTWPS